MQPWASHEGKASFSAAPAFSLGLTAPCFFGRRFLLERGASGGRAGQNFEAAVKRYAMRQADERCQAAFVARGNDQPGNRLACCVRSHGGQAAKTLFQPDDLVADDAPGPEMAFKTPDLPLLEDAAVDGLGGEGRSPRLPALGMRGHWRAEKHRETKEKNIAPKHRSPISCGVLARPPEGTLFSIRKRGARPPEPGQHKINFPQ